MSDRYKITFWSSFTGSKQIPTATVRVEVDGKEKRGAEFGEGPVNALFKAIRSATGENCSAGHFSISSEGLGSAGPGEVNVTVVSGLITASGVGKSNDILEAAAHAYANAMSKLYVEKKRRGEWPIDGDGQIVATG